MTTPAAIQGRLATFEVPFEAQEERPDGRLCGAAALTMVYRSFGLECTQAELWGRIARPGIKGKKSVRTHLLARDSLAQSLTAVIVQTNDAWQALTRCVENEVRVILNHRLAPASTTGHYSVLLGIEKDHIWLHDPLLGPDRRMFREDLFDRWRPRGPHSEVAGFVFVAFAGRSLSPVCSECGAGPPRSTTCKNCGQSIPLDVAPAFGCWTDHCPRATWRRVFCPACDAAMTRSTDLRKDTSSTS